MIDVNILPRIIVAGTPLLFAALGEIYSERSGVLNLGIEGIFVLGGATSFVLTVMTGNPYIGLLAASISGLILGLIHGFITSYMKGNQILTGLSITLIGYGLSSLIGKNYVGRSIPSVIYLRSGWMTLILLSLIVVLGLWIILMRLKIGTLIRSCGEDPESAYTLGVDVNRVRTMVTGLGAALSGLAGGIYIVGYIHVWTEGAGSGLGWIALAIVIASGWHPLMAPIVSYVFGGIIVSMWILQLPPYNLSPYLTSTIPYASTIIILILFTSTPLRKYYRPPQALGKIFHREERTV